MIAAKHDVEEVGEVTECSEKSITRDEEGSDDESFSEEDLATGMLDGLKKPKQSKICDSNKKKVKSSKANVNVFRLDLSSLDNNAPVITGDPVRCCGCGAMLNLYSKVEDATSEQVQEFLNQQESVQKLELAPPIHTKFEGCVATKASVGNSGSIWNCEFCATANLIDLDEEEIEQIRQNDTLDFLVQIPEKTEFTTNDNSKIVVFCIDVSGSMCVTTEVEGTIHLKGADRRRRENFEIAQSQHATYGQWFPGQRRDVTHVSRLQCVQAAVTTQIEKLCETSPETKVALITFSNEVNILGDGSQEPVVIAGDKLSSWEGLMEIGKQFRIASCVGEAKKTLLDTLWGLEEGGRTALGPALQVSIAVASIKPGSTIVLCTDGLANMGVGALEDIEFIEGSDTNAKLFYTELGERARLYGLTVNIISLIGDDGCRLDALNSVTEQSRGTVERVAATELHKQLSAIVEKPTVATGVMAMVCLSRLLHFKGEMDDELERRNWLVKDLGTVHKGDECTFSYGFRDVKADDEMVSFQVQVLHTREDLTEVLRVSTARIKLTSDRGEAEKHANAAVVATHATQRAANKAKKGDFRAAQLEMRSAQRFMQRANMDEHQVSAWSSNVDEIDRVLREEEGNAATVSDNATRNISKFAQISTDNLF
eukprot:TRINITY_DN4564_c0_g1_i3.p1 TRINITY_DN4564_c0_g1~~TRINITY_DN4564_c0_g1_i3.p1  ORF type:complete len:654 (+),score=143.17 TRINITY_DN4564_c0_g1_i3:848-2809(+)